MKPLKIKPSDVLHLGNTSTAPQNNPKSFRPKSLRPMRSMKKNKSVGAIVLRPLESILNPV
ncbi:MAG: hypothetical protein KBD63_05745 [Bacteriovoracaceae bacterium]|nr:hypothetical protein [Bacteriovoracaceae bacterium]